MPASVVNFTSSWEFIKMKTCCQGLDKRLKHGLGFVCVYIPVAWWQETSNRKRSWKVQTCILKQPTLLNWVYSCSHIYLYTSVQCIISFPGILTSSLGNGATFPSKIMSFGTRIRSNMEWQTLVMKDARGLNEVTWIKIQSWTDLSRLECDQVEVTTF